MIKTLTTKKNSILPFGVLINKFFSYKGVPKKSSDVTQKTRNPINSRTLALSTAHVPPTPQDDEAPEEEATPATKARGSIGHQMIELIIWPLSYRVWLRMLMRDLTLLVKH